MKLLVFSDSHGRMEPMRSVLLAHLKDTDALLHLGDGATEVYALREEFPALPIYAVRGNCDPYSCLARDVQPEQCLMFGTRTVFFCHGDRFGVGGGLGALEKYARARGADIALFGHTHKAHEEYRPAETDSEKPLWLLSPGSAALPRDGAAPSFGILDITPSGILFSVGRRPLR